MKKLNILCLLLTGEVNNGCCEEQAAAITRNIVTLTTIVYVSFMICSCVIFDQSSDKIV